MLVLFATSVYCTKFAVQANYCYTRIRKEEIRYANRKTNSVRLGLVGSTQGALVVRYEVPFMWQGLVAILPLLINGTRLPLV